MRIPDVVYYAASSLDGYIATPSGGVEWLDPFQAAGEDHGFAEFYASVDALLIGSRTYEFALAHPPWRSADKPSWVFTRRELPILHSSITLTGDEPARIVESLQGRGIQRLWLMGGGRLAASFREQGLLSHCKIAVVPVILGSGIPLFANAPRQDSLKLVDVTPYPTGIVLLSYEVVQNAVPSP